MRKKYSYIDDEDFLKELDLSPVQEQYVKITLLDFDENPIEDIEGQITSGTLNKDGSSTVRRTCSLSCSVDMFTYKIDDIKSKYSINKKIYLEIGVKNQLQNDSNYKRYKEHDIIYFPQGVFFITGCSVNAAASGSVNLSLNFKDKMAQLDGTIGGVLPAAVRFDLETTENNGIKESKKVLVYDIIMELVNHYGEEDLTNIVIDDVPLGARRVVRWNGESPFWIVWKEDDDSTLVPVREDDMWLTPGAYEGRSFKLGKDIGYMYQDFIYDDELTFDAGATVTQVLDQLKNWLGNFEYFYDEYGVFHFQEIKNYLNTTQTKYLWTDELTDDDYIYDVNASKSVYTFDDTSNLISVTNTPSYDNIKNDYYVIGTAELSNGVQYTVTYHLAIDDKPEINTDGYSDILLYVDPDTGDYTLTIPEIITEPVVSEDGYNYIFPETGDINKIYGILDNPDTKTVKTEVKNVIGFASAYSTVAAEENELYLKGFSQIDDDIYLLIIKELADTLSTCSQLGSISENYMTEINNCLLDFVHAGWSLPKDSDYTDAANTIIQYMTGFLFNLLQSGNATINAFLQYYLLYTILNKNYSVSCNSSYSNQGKIRYNETNFYGDTVSITLPGRIAGDRILNYSTYYDGFTCYQASNCKQVLGFENLVSSLTAEIKVIDAKINSIENILLSKTLGYLVPLSTDTTITKEQRAKIKNYIANLRSQAAKTAERRTLLLSFQNQCYNKICEGLQEEAIATVIKPEKEAIYDASAEMPFYNSVFKYWDGTNLTWKEVEWIKYYHVIESASAYMPFGWATYCYVDLDNATNKYAYWYTDTNKQPSYNCNSSWFKDVFVPIAEVSNDGIEYIKDPTKNETYIAQDWRTELFLQGLQSSDRGTEVNRYYTELKALWPTIYDLYHQRYYDTTEDCDDYIVGNMLVLNEEVFSFETLDGGEVTIKEAGHSKSYFEEHPDTNSSVWVIDTAFTDNTIYGYYYLDIIDASSSSWGEYSINNIGKRTRIDKNEEVNCLFGQEIPSYGFVVTSEETTKEERDKQKAALQEYGCDYIIQVTPEMSVDFITGGSDYAAYDTIRYDLLVGTNYQNNLSFTSRPIFYLEPNTRITMQDDATGTYGDYILKTVSLPLGVGQAMSATASLAVEKF